MASLASLLPHPKHSATTMPVFPTITDVRAAPAATAPAAAAPATRSFEPPAYGTRLRVKFVPRTEEDYGDGGAFPEVHVTQFPLNMGRRKDKAGSGSGSSSGATGETRVVPLQVDAEGNVQYDAILRQSTHKAMVVFSKPKDLAEKDLAEEELRRPSPEEEQKLAEKTRTALGSIVEKKVATALPTHVAKTSSEPTYIRYTPGQAQNNDEFNSGAKQRIIRLQEVPQDPLEPPKFKHKKMPAAPPSPPVPVMHSPPRKLTVEDQQNWKVPPSISNWKNIKGYTVPLDKRLAADGRGLTEVQVNHKFVHLSEALYKAEQIAREEIEARAKLQTELARKRKQAQEEQLRDLAAKAREEAAKRMERKGDAEAEEDIKARDERQQLMREREREVRRDMRMEAMTDENRKKANRVRNEEDRDVSERIALGQAPPKSKDSQFDQRLFNQSQGMDQGFRTDESYDLYDKPLFSGSSANFMYKPKQVDDEAYGGDANLRSTLEKSTSKFKADQEFKGTEGARGGRPREKPVEFEREQSDPFAIDAFYSDVRKKNPLDSIGKQGRMSASGGSSRDQEHSRRHDSGRSVEFEESSGRGGDADTSKSSNHKRRKNN